MKLRSFTTWILLGLISATVMVTGTARHREFKDEALDDSNTNQNPNLLQIGTVTFHGRTGCPAGAITGTVCQSITVSCPGIPDLKATLGSASPSGTAKGTIILLNGGPGTKFFKNSNFADTYLADGFNVAELAWATDWASANGAGVKSAACRPATVFKTIFDTVQRGSRTTGFCGQGISGGAAALAYSLAHYGFGDYFDYVVMAAPALARMDYGCDAALYTGAPRDLCPLLPNAPFAYASGKLVNGWEDTTTCAAENPLPSDISRWRADSIVSSGANYSYPHTAISWYFCATSRYAGDGNTGQSTFLIDQVVPKNAPSDVNCYTGTCHGESVWEDPNAFSTTVSEMLAQCVPNH
ncbi:MAG TPA: hypothetical protein VG206_11510 [Terriglobia bacterium]|nr:hypothetical protein [Terriglobia bacterium]